MIITTQQAANQLKAGKVVALPTETVYGLAAMLNQPLAIVDIFRLKKRPQDNPLIIHLLNATELSSFVKDPLPPFTQELAARFWPGPLTLILPICEEAVPSSVRANQPNAAFRVPNHPCIREVLALTGPLVAPSANLSGKPSPTTAEHVWSDFQGEIPVVNGGPCIQGVESTILTFQEHQWYVARLGAIPAETFISLLGYQPAMITSQALHCPGSRYKHYAPKAKLILGYAKEATVVIGFSNRSYPGATVLHFGSSNDPAGALQTLYGILRQLDEQNIPAAWVDFDIPRQGLWLTLRERLQRAAQQ